MQGIDLLVRRFPGQELTLRRLCCHDAEFRAVCDDYADVRRALEHWQAREPGDPERIAEYRRMLEELEAEALTFLTASGET